MPNPWTALTARPDLLLVRWPMSDYGRYYHAERTIVVRQGLLLEEERRVLWHELVHSDRGDQACHNDMAVERSVDREALRRAMPLSSLRWALTTAAGWYEAADRLKLPEPWVRQRYATAHAVERTAMDQAMRQEDEAC